MGRTTGIAWARSTFNPWLGCTEVSPGCDHCYARELDKRHRYGGATHWGAGVPRYRTAVSTWGYPEKWNKIAALERETGSCVDGSGRNGQRAMGISEGWHKPGFWPVFPSLCDPFDNEVPEEWRDDFLELIRRTPNLTWLLLTKRIGNVARMLPSGPRLDEPWRNLWIGASIVNQEEADRDITKLLAVRGVAKRFVSYEPALGPVDFHRFLYVGEEGGHEYVGSRSQMIAQIIVGGESRQGKHEARPFAIQWARDTLRQCRAAGTACFVKQLGSYAVNVPPDGDVPFKLLFKDRAGADPAEWPPDLRVQEFPA